MYTRTLQHSSTVKSVRRNKVQRDISKTIAELRDLIEAVSMLDEALVMMQKNGLYDTDLYKRIDAFLYYQPGEGEWEEVE
ncbi:hypothetical protein QE327_gp013 [Pseudomonas phage Henu5]|uniref:Uncharacterized protein n=1 Tax=Pseudomonas phage Henu5 TaxID=2499902 RepID=A0A410T7X8_9CAUD|nr:hypothetical protein QE327_gp013 [Pseudomonas phage Henu5]QAU05046.1 hypothetical protein Henu5_gp14 [Pseudomonas phage Henu5]